MLFITAAMSVIFKDVMAAYYILCHQAEMPVKLQEQETIHYVSAMRWFAGYILCGRAMLGNALLWAVFTA